MRQKSRPQFGGVPYSLHDAHINRIVLEESDDDLFITVTFYFNEGYYVPEGDDVVPVKGYITIQKVDPDYSNIDIIETNSRGKIKGRRYSLKQFVEKFPAVDMEIAEDVYHGCISKFCGLVWPGNRRKEMQEFCIDLFHFGDMIFITD